MAKVAESEKLKKYLEIREKQPALKAFILDVITEIGKVEPGDNVKKITDQAISEWVEKWNKKREDKKDMKKKDTPEDLEEDD